MYHLHTKTIGRSSRGSAVAAAAYKSGRLLIENIVDQDTGISFSKVHDYSSKDGVVYDEILAPLESAEWMKDHHKLWNKIQTEFDKYKKSQFAHDIEAALPKELSQEQNIELTKEFVKEVFVERGLVC